MDEPVPGAGAAAAASSMAPPPPQPRQPWWHSPRRVRAAAVLLLLLLSLTALGMAWRAQHRLHGLEQELVRRQQDSQSQSTEARMLARQAQEEMREAAAKVALLEARLAEVTIQRGQLDDLMQSLTRSRDENLLVDIDSGIRVALQQSTLTGSAEPLVAALKQADDRLLRHAQPRLEGVRRAIARDLDRVRAVGVADLPSLGIKLDEAVRLVDELPLLSTAPPLRDGSRGAAPPPATAAAPATGGSASAGGGWLHALDEAWHTVWAELASLLRVTRIDHPDAALLAPEHAFFIRENLKLRLLNARLALLARQHDTAQADLQSAQASLDRWFDRGARRTVLAADLLRQVAAQARQVAVPRPDDTLAALSALNPAAGR